MEVPGTHLPVRPSEVLYCTSKVALIQFHEGKSIRIPSNAKVHSTYAELSALLSAGQLLDLVVKDDVKSYRIHSIILTANSPKYRETIAEKQNRIKEVALKGIKTDCLGSVLEFLYSGHLTITRETVRDILEIADQLDLVLVSQEGERFLKCYDVTCALDFLPLAIDYNFHSVSREISNFLRRYAPLVLENEKFVTMDADCLLCIIEFGENDKNDEPFFLVKVLQWISHSLDVRKADAGKLLAKIHWSNIPIEKIDSTMDAYPDLFESMECQNAVYEAFKCHALKAVEEGYEPKVADWKNAPFFENLSQV